jgi:ribosomal protein L29
MARKRTRESLEHDLRRLSGALADYEAGVMAGMDPSEQAHTIETIKQRIAELNARIAQLGKP